MSQATDKGTRNIAASIRQKLKNRASRDKRPFAELLQYYAMERFFYRLTQSEHADCFVLKGALMLRAWQSPDCHVVTDSTVCATDAVCWLTGILRRG